MPDICDQIIYYGDELLQHNSFKCIIVAFALRCTEISYNMLRVNEGLANKGNVSRAVDQNSLTPWGNNNFSFRLTRDQVMHLETAANLCASQSQEKDFSQLCFLFLSWEV